MAENDDLRLLVGQLTIVLPWLWTELAVMAKRVHDHGRSVAWLLMGLIPLLNIWVWVTLNLLPGTSGPNRFGPDLRS